MKQLLLAHFVVISLAGSGGLAQSTSGPTSQPAHSPVTKLTVHSATATPDWSRYRLIPSVLDQEPGNSVPFYLMSRQFWPDEKTTIEVLEPENRKYDYLATPIDQFPRQYATRLLDAYRRTLVYAELGARRRDADWARIWDVDPPRPDLIGQGRFNYIENLRHVENLLSFRSRLEMSQGDWTAAVHTVQNMFSIARHVGTENLFIHKLVEMSFDDLTLAVSLEEWIGRAGSPNLYWPLTNLPRPQVVINTFGYYDDPAALKWEPSIVRAMKGSLPKDKWPQALREIIGRGQAMRKPYTVNAEAVEKELKQLVDAQFETARQSLLTDGTAEDSLRGMSREQVVGEYMVRQYKRITDALWKAFGLPFPQASAEMFRVWKDAAPQQPPASMNLLIQEDLVSANDVYPNPLRFRYQMERVDRYVALLRVIEALRDYASKHDGRPPTALDDVKDLVVPADPMTGKPFGYQVKGNVVTLDATPPKPFGVFSGWRYELKFAK